MKPRMFVTIVTSAIILSLLIFTEWLQIPHWTLILSYPAAILLGFWAGWQWRDLKAGNYLLLGITFGGSLFLLIQLGFAVFYPDAFDLSLYQFLFYPFIAVGIVCSLFFTGLAVVGNMVANKRVTADRAVIATVVSLLGAITSLIAAIKQ
jgi:hypothetical protein